MRINQQQAMIRLYQPVWPACHHCSSLKQQTLLRLHHADIVCLVLPTMPNMFACDDYVPRIECATQSTMLTASCVSSQHSWQGRVLHCPVAAQ